MDNNEKIYESIVDYETIHNNIKKYRILSGLSQSQLAEKSNISTKYLSRLENNHYKSHLHVYLQITDALQISIYDLINNDEEKNSFVEQIKVLTKDLSKNQKDLLLDEIKVLKKHKF